MTQCNMYVVPKARKFECVGPGGRACVCCYPAPNSKARYKTVRRGKRKAEREYIRIMEQEVADTHTT